jgi:hypothetical protein
VHHGLDINGERLKAKGYEKEGSKILQRLLSRQKKESSE